MLVHGPYPVGEPRVAREAAVALAEGFEVDVVAMRRPGEPPLEVVDGVRVIRLPLSHRRGAGFTAVVAEYISFTIAAALRVALLHVRRRYDVVHIHNPPDFLVAAALLPKAFGARLVFDVHDLSTHMFGSRFHSRRGYALAALFLRAVERAAAGAADVVLTVHEPYRRELVAHGTPLDAVTVVMNALDERLLPDVAPPEPGGRFRVVYHGTITPSYGLEVVVGAARRLDRRADFVFELYGDGDAVRDVRAAAAAAGLGDRFHVNGEYLPHREVLARIAGASVGVIPNLPTELNRFALSSKLFEYVALGIPVVSADLPTIRAHFSDDEVRFFRAGDAEALATAIEDIVGDPERAAAQAAHALRRYEQYRWPVQAARYADVLRTLVRS